MSSRQRVNRVEEPKKKTGAKGEESYQVAMVEHMNWLVVETRN